MSSWWELGEDSGYQGDELALFRITCAFCLESGHFETAHHVEKKHPDGSKTLNYDTLRCTNCGNFTMVFWSGSGSGSLHNFKTVPWPRETTRFPDYWPPDVGRYWLQAQRSLEASNWDAAAVMARSALQLSARLNGAAGSNLKQEINDLAQKGLLPPVMVEWSHEVRELGNDSAHPSPNSAGASAADAKDIGEFLTTMLTFLYQIPHQIAEYRARKKT
jgi:hypothetical protein